MVKVKEDEAQMAEPRPSPASTSAIASGTGTIPSLPSSSRHHKTINSRHHHHLHPLQHFHHFHHHWSYPDASACPTAGPATFHFGPGFEPQQPLPSRFTGVGPPPTPAPNTNPGPSSSSEHIVHFHVNPGVTVSFQIGDSMELIRGPVTVPMVSTNSSPPIAMPVQVPPGHVVQQIVDESGTLRHVILSPQPPLVPMAHTHNPQHYGAGPGNGNNQAPQTFFTQGLPPGYPPPPHYHSNMAPTHMGHIPATAGHVGHSPPPPHGFHKDERTQRQYNKLKRKLEQKRSDGLNSGPNTPLLSPRKELVNGLRRGAAGKDRGMNSVGTSEDGEESSSVQDDEDEVNVITDVLSSVQSPQVSELSSRSALLQWSVPPRLSSAATNGNQDLDICESDLRYDVLLSDKGKEGKYKSIYSGASLSCRIQDLKPGQEYSVCLQVHFDELQGSASDPITFTTPACEPDQPPPPKLISRTKTSLQLRWNAVADNGSHILQYILEYDEGKGGGFVELSKCRGKQYNLTKLQPSTVYKFRLAAVNECGKSNYSDIISFSTSGSPPAQPNAPLLKDASIDSLRLVWNRRPTDDDFTLQMDNMQSGYGFMNAYVGKDTECVCENLSRYTDYKFRLRAHNEESPSSWSEEVCYRTLPDRPVQPARPTVKGRIHAHSFKLKWEPPHDNGGADITTYILELSSGSSYETVYTGSETEAVCDKLTPGTTYQLRVSCISAGGRSNYSDPCTVTTEAICPGKCSNLRMLGKPRATSISLKWTEPEYNGGAPVTEYELDLVEEPSVPTSARQLMYRGREAECTVPNLLPGNEYSFSVRALNRVGGGPWSEVASLCSAAAAPETPQAPNLIAKSPFHVLVDWAEPQLNGAPLTEYRLEMSTVDQEEQYLLVFQGLSTSYEVKGLTPFTTYFFRVQACNIAGCSTFSHVSATMTPASPPNTMPVPRYEATPTTLTLYWHEPTTNGSDILNYIIEIGDKSILTEPITEYTIENLKPETSYKIKVKAVNSVGASQFSPLLRATTLPLPPTAPRLDCIGVGHNYLKLKWGDGKNSDFTQYSVELENLRTKEFQCIYQGTNYTYKVNKLQELTTYKFRICATNDAGQGDFSELYAFKTSIAPPLSLKAPKVIEVTQRTCSIEWTPCKMLGSDPIEYSVQFSRQKEQDFKQIYRGPETKYTLIDLDAGVDYNVRVCPIRLASSGELAGVYSPATNFQTIATEPVLSTKQTVPQVTSSPTRGRKNQRLFSWLTNTLQHSDKKPMSDQQWAIVIILGFTVFAFVAAVVVESLFINWRKSV